MCDKLIVGVTTDPLVSYKNKTAVIPFEERIEIVRACRYVDLAVPQDTMDKMDAYNRYKFNVMFIGDDGTKKTNGLNWILSLFGKLGVRIIYFPYTKSTSSTLINQTLERLRKGDA